MLGQLFTCCCAAAAIAARGNYTDMDILEFLTNVECLEGLFDTWGTFGRGFNGDLEMGGPIPMGAQKANLSYEIQAFMSEIALNEQASSLAALRSCHCFEHTGKLPPAYSGCSCKTVHDH